MSNHKDLVLFYTKARLESEVLKNYFGYIWWVLDPLMAVGVYYVVFKLLFNRGGDDYIPFLFVGIIVWKWFHNSVSKGSLCIFSQKGLYARIKVPKIIFPWIE